MKETHVPGYECSQPILTPSPTFWFEINCGDASILTLVGWGGNELIIPLSAYYQLLQNKTKQFLAPSLTAPAPSPPAVSSLEITQHSTLATDKSWCSTKRPSNEGCTINLIMWTCYSHISMLRDSRWLTTLRNGVGWETWRRWKMWRRLLRGVLKHIPVECVISCDATTMWSVW